MDIGMFFIWGVQYLSSLCNKATEIIKEAVADIQEQRKIIVSLEMKNATLEMENTALKLELAKSMNNETSTNQ